MNDILKAALQTKYNLSRKEAIENIEEARKKGKLWDLYQIALMKFEMEMNEDV